MWASLKSKKAEGAPGAEMESIYISYEFGPNSWGEGVGSAM